MIEFMLEDIYEDYMHLELEHSSGRHVQFDVFIPNLNLGLEYQGEQHYMNVYPFGSLQTRTERDEEKRQHCKRVSGNVCNIN